MFRRLFTPLLCILAMALSTGPVKAQAIFRAGRIGHMPFHFHSSIKPLAYLNALAIVEREADIAHTGGDKLSVWIVVAYILGGGGILFAAYSYYSHNGRLHRHRKAIEELRMTIDQLNRPVSSVSQTEELKQKVRQLIAVDPSIQGLESEIRGLSTRIENLGKSNIKNFSFQPDMPFKPQPVASSSSRESLNVFYMSYPVEGSFLEQSRSDRKEHSIYRFRLIPGGNEAEFELHTEGGAQVSELISGVEQFIRPACIEDNLPTLETQRIITKKAGLAVLNGGRWNISKKAEIIYE